MLSETRKFNLFAMLSHQTLDQVPDRMRSGLQNVEVDITFRTGRDDAKQQAKVVGNVDPFSVKHEVAEHQERSHPTFFPLQEQWEGWTQELTKLKIARGLYPGSLRQRDEGAESRYARSGR
jgi:hypothetical protein